jgi:hypothetical protein
MALAGLSGQPSDPGKFAERKRGYCSSPRARRQPQRAGIDCDGRVLISVPTATTIPGNAVVIAIATSIMRIVAFTLPRSELPRCATRHKLGIQTYKCRAGRQIAMLFERAAWSEHSLGKAAAVARIY